MFSIQSTEGYLILNWLMKFMNGQFPVSYSGQFFFILISSFMNQTWWVVADMQQDDLLQNLNPFFLKLYSILFAVPPTFALKHYVLDRKDANGVLSQLSRVVILDLIIYTLYINICNIHLAIKTSHFKIILVFTRKYHYLKNIWLKMCTLNFGFIWNI